MVNEGTIGGTCVNVGCVPSKTLIRAAEARHPSQPRTRWAAPKRSILSVLPAVTFPDPGVASVGLTEHGAREAGIEPIASKLGREHVPQSIAARDTRGLIKLAALTFGKDVATLSCCAV